MAFTIIKAKRINFAESAIPITFVTEFMINTDHIIDICYRQDKYEVEMATGVKMYTDEVGFRRICTALQMNNPVPQIRSQEEVERELKKESN